MEYSCVGTAKEVDFSSFYSILVVTLFIELFSKTLMIAFSISLAAVRANSMVFAPVITILPVENIKPVALGSLIRITAAENRLGLYSTFLHQRAICRKLSLNVASGRRLAVDTMFTS